ncbi:MAG: hypothetical protein IKD24_02485 [Alistipes sp.]|nr:hypothetical protein [Alistipes sp.]
MMQYVCYVKISLANGYVIESNKYTTHVTGIPYSIKFYGSNLDDIRGEGWTLNGSPKMDKASTGDNFLCLYENVSKSTKNNGYAVSPAFPVGANTDINFTISHKSYWIGFSSKAISGYIGATSSATSSASSYVTLTPTSTTSPGTDDMSTQSSSLTLTPTNKFISINHNTQSAGLTEFNYMVHSFSVQYK